MAETTGIQWTDATINFWWGCTKVGPGCDNCYAERDSTRYGHDVFGHGKPRRKIESAATTLAKINRTRPGSRVFLQSMSDLFDKEVPAEWLNEAWAGITLADNLRLQIVTKRISFVEKRMKEIGADVWPWPSNAGLIITVVNQEEADRDVPRLLALKAKLDIPWVGISYEPALGPIDFCKISRMEMDGEGAFTGQKVYLSLNALRGAQSLNWTGLDWIIFGGESGPKYRHAADLLTWAESTMNQCRDFGVAFFMKQTQGKTKASMPPIPDHLMIRQFPGALT